MSHLPNVIVLVGFVLVNAVASAGFAHTLYLFAAADGEKITGRVYLRGGVGLPDVLVKVHAAGKEPIAEVRTDAEGRFSFSAPYRCDYVLRVATEDGHQAEASIRADELPPSLPTPPGKEAVPATAEARKENAVTQLQESSESPSSSEDHGIESSNSESLKGSHPEVLQQLATLRSQVIQLREELRQFQTSTSFRDILGGVGYILGLMGVSFYFLGKKHRKE